MSKQIQKSSILIPQNIEIGKLIGREGRNLKPISEKTGTHIYVDTNKIPAQIKIYVNNKKEIPPFENRINDASSQLNDLINKISQYKTHSFKHNEQVKYRFSTVKEKEKTETSLITANIINEDLPEKFSQAIFKERRNKDMIKKLPISDDRMCWYGANCKKNFCRFKHPQYIIDHHLILKYKKEIETKKHKRDFKKESRIFLHKYRNRELLKKFLKV
uniref:K Homology domain-containing protein n=1 Tax=Rhizophagus irregularis (strain DAOM 181602 / DAOM 197198 / MUCL 43194) TaxID=747089 RepID=U9T6P0_RHIID